MKKLEQNIHVNQDPIDIHVESESVQSVEDEYQDLSWLDKVIIIIKSFLLKKNKFDLTKKLLVGRIARRVHYMNSQYFNLKQMSVLSDFHNSVTDLYRSLEFIKKPITECFEDNKEFFYLLLGRLEFPSIVSQLETALDPFILSEKNPSLDIQEVRKSLTGEMENLISQITKNDRTRMMESTRILYHIYKLTLFPFQKIVSHFPVASESQVLPANASMLKPYLMELNDILKSFCTPPSLKLLEAVFLFSYGRDQDAVDGGMESYIEKQMTKAGTLIHCIREFNRNIGLSDFLKVLAEDPYYVPADIGGGEDWYYFFLQYWQDVLSDAMKIFTRKRMIDAGRNELLRFWEVSGSDTLKSYSPSVSPYCSFFVSLSLLNTFVMEILQKKLYYCLKIILVDGEFYKKNNRSEYEETFENMMGIGDRIRWFENYLEPDGEGGMKIRDILHDSELSERDKEKKLRSVYINVNRDALSILEMSVKYLFSMGKLLNGIILGNGGTYDTLSNLSELGGRGNAEFRSSVQDAADHIHKVSHSLSDLMNYEKEADQDIKV